MWAFVQLAVVLVQVVVIVVAIFLLIVSSATLTMHLGYVAFEEGTISKLFGAEGAADDQLFLGL